MLDLIALHLLGDFILQNDWMAVNKRSSAYARLVHVLAYSTAFLAWGIYFHGWQGVYFALAVAITHYLTDSVTFYPAHPWPPKGIAIDQSVHIITLAVLVHIFL